MLVPLFPQKNARAPFIALVAANDVGQEPSMAKKSRQSFLKRQRERDRAEKAAEKRRKRAERRAEKTSDDVDAEVITGEAGSTDDDAAAAQDPAYGDGVTSRD
jgi:hypothetical protein